MMWLRRIGFSKDEVTTGKIYPVIKFTSSGYAVIISDIGEPYRCNFNKKSFTDLWEVVGEEEEDKCTSQ